MRCNRYSRRATPFLLSMTVFVLALTAAASGERKESVLYSFQGVPDGSTPAGGVVFGKDGNLYGATTDGGANPCSPSQCGTVFQLIPPAKQGEAWTEAVIHIFQGNTHGDGNTPQGGVIFDPAGNLYGTTAYGGTGNCILLGTKTGCGTVYQMQPPVTKGGAWTEKVLYSFKGGKDSQLPQGELVFDTAGNIYGATQYGGGYGSCNAPFYQHCGTVFEVSPPKVKGDKWTEKVLYSFKGGNDGANPNGGLVFDRNGVIYGTTKIGGFNCPHNSEQGCGTAFALTPTTQESGSWTESVLYRFMSSPDGALPGAGMVFDKGGNLYGTTESGGGGNFGSGTVFRLTPPRANGVWVEKVMYSFQDGSDGGRPQAGVIFDSKGDLYGTATGGGTEGNGTVFRLRHLTGSEWAFSPMYEFRALPDCVFPASNLKFDAAGNIYGTAQGGGSGQTCGNFGCGAVFELRP